MRDMTHTTYSQVLFSLYVVVLLVGYYYTVFLGSICHASAEGAKAVR